MFRTPIIGSTFLVLLSATAHANILGFNNLTGWTYNQGDAGTPADLPTASSVHITTGNIQHRSVFFNTPQNISAFTASFTYRAANFNATPAQQGIAFVIQNSPAGALAQGIFPDVGYAGIASSAAVVFGSDTGPAKTFNGFLTGGVTGGGANDMSPANAFNFRDLNVSITYTNPILTVTVDDPFIAGGPEFSKNYIVGNLAATIGGSTAFVGFTAGAGDNGGNNQYLSNFVFSSVPEPASLSLLVVGTLSLLVRRRTH